MQPAHALSLSLACVVALAPASRADLDVAAPPQLPLDRRLPRHEPSDLLLPPQALPAPGAGEEGDEEGPEDETRVRRRVERGPTAARRSSGPTKARPVLPVEVEDGMTYARIVTLDMFNELGWPKGPAATQMPVLDDLRTRRPETGDGEGPGPKDDPALGLKAGPELGGEYPRPISPDLFWTALGQLLQVAFHPGQTSELEALEKLVEIGAPSLAVVQTVLNSGFGKAGQRGMVDRDGRKVGKFIDQLLDWEQRLEQDVGYLPAYRPFAFVDEGDPRRTQRLWLAAEELGQTYANGMMVDFAPRLRALPPSEAVDALLPYVSTRAHLLLRRNAVSLLGSYRGPQVTRALKRLLRDPDEVVQRRAWWSLLDADPGVLAGFCGEQTRLSPFEIYVGSLALGDAVAPSLPPLIRSDDPLQWLVALRALGRSSRRARSAALQQVREIERRAQTLTPAQWLGRGETLVGDTGDHPQARAWQVEQLILLARARLGEAGAPAQIAKLLEAEPKSGSVVRGSESPAWLRDPHASRETFGGFVPRVWPVVIEALGQLGLSTPLETIAGDRLCDLGLRQDALARLAELGPVKPELLVKLLEDRLGTIRATALRLLAGQDPVAGRDAALDVLLDLPELLAAARRQPRTPQPGWQLNVQAAFEVLLSQGPRGVAQTVKLRARSKLRLTPESEGLVLEELPKGTRVEVRSVVGEWVLIKVELKDKRKPGLAEPESRTVEGFVPRKRVKVPEPALLLARTLAQLADFETHRKKLRDKVRTAAQKGGSQLILYEPDVLERVIAAAVRRPSPEIVRALGTILENPGAQRETVIGAVLQALAQIEGRRSGPTLLKFLKASSAWARFCADRSLRWLAAPEEQTFCDWLFKKQGRDEVRQAWAEWVAAQEGRGP